MGQVAVFNGPWLPRATGAGTGQVTVRAKRGTKARDICSLRPNKSNVVVDHACFVIQDLEEEGRDCLSDSCKVIIGQLSGD